VHLNRPVKGQWLDNLAVFSVPWRFCNCYGFFLVFEILNFRQINSTQHVSTTKHEHNYQSGTEALISVPLQTLHSCLCHVSYHCLMPIKASSTVCFPLSTRNSSWGSKRRNRRLVRTPWFITTTKVNTISLGWLRLQRFTQCPAEYSESLGLLAATRCTREPHYCLVRSLPNCWCWKSAQRWWAPYCNSPSNWCQNFRKHKLPQR